MQLHLREPARPAGRLPAAQSFLQRLFSIHTNLGVVLWHSHVIFRCSSLEAPCRQDKILAMRAWAGPRALKIGAGHCYRLTGGMAITVQALRPSEVEIAAFATMASPFCAKIQELQLLGWRGSRASTRAAAWRRKGASVRPKRDTRGRSPQKSYGNVAISTYHR